MRKVWEGKEGMRGAESRELLEGRRWTGGKILRLIGSFFEI